MAEKPDEPTVYEAPELADPANAPAFEELDKKLKEHEEKHPPKKD